MKHLHLKGVFVSAVLCALLLSALVLVGCAGKGSLSSDLGDGDGAYKVTADDAGKGSAVMASGGFVVEEGQIVVISPDMTKGNLQIRLLNASGDLVIDEKVSGHVLSTYEVASGDYGIAAVCNEDGATGTVLVVAVDKAEFEKQNQDLEAALAAMTASGAASASSAESSASVESAESAASAAA